MVLGPIIGAGLGALAGIGVGSVVFSGDRPKNYNFIIEAADSDNNIRVPAAANITDEMRTMIPLTPEWTSWPDYDRWMMINRVVRLMWPKLTSAILKQIILVVKPMIQGILNGMPFVLAVLDDITLGPYSLMDAEHLDPHIADKYFTLGDFPVRVSGMKVYHTADETCILETPVIWGSNAAFDIQVYIRIAGRRFVLPISVRDIQFKAHARLILHMVPTLPCIGGATLSLLSVPHVDFKFHLFNGPDLMALPGVRALTQMAITYVVKELALYPNYVSVPLLKDYGVPPSPKGMVHVKLHKITDLKSTDLLTKGDPYVVFEVRPGRSQRSKTVKNNANPIYNEEFFLLVDDFENQSLKIKVYDFDRLCPTDDLLGVAEVFFTEEEIEHDEDGGQQVVYNLADWVASPMIEKKVCDVDGSEGLTLRQAGAGLLKSMGSMAAGAAKSAASAVESLVTGVSEADTDYIEIEVAKTKKQIRLEQEREAQAKKQAEAAAKAAAAAKAEAEARAAAQAAGPTALAAYEAARAAEAARRRWTDEDEKAYWAEIKRIADEKKAAEAAEAKRRKALTKEQREAEDKAKKEAEEAAQAADEEIELTTEKVVLRPTPKAGKSVGKIHLSLKFMPFEEPKFDDDIELKPLKSGLSAYVPFDPPKPREFAASVNDFQKGVLTVTIFKASGLTQPNSLLSPDPYVELILVDCDRLRPRETQKTSIKYNDNTPRWAETFDFVMVSAGSVLTVNIMNKVTLVGAVASLKVSKERFQDRMLGRVQIPVKDVARNGCLKDTWALLDAESGTIEMKLEWQDCFVDQYMD